MVLAAFDINDQVAFSAVVFARDGNHARRLGHEHRASFRSSATSPLTIMERVPPLGGPAGDHHLAAIEADVPGVGHRQQDGSWLVLPPGVRPIQAHPAKPTRMYHFSDDDGYEVVLFARDQERAGELYDAVVLDYRVLPREWLGSEWEAWSAIGIVRHAAQAEARGVEGVGTYNAEGWLILPLDYKALGVAPPE
ncbi:hypothetical protein [Sphingomonas sp. Ag1]|jgi:hypothetical protein|uniref:hypothetical protein n=1 Tax=Sphingomonas sp. Ag1 TaxID=1642949 RepID=UPI000621A180|nr:hypothetical protein [Sphingomonas sp. Ag1]KKI17899.1 hypothetical protein XM50_16930 [Sphingomonas sp. Ag1]